MNLEYRSILDDAAAARAAKRTLATVERRLRDAVVRGDLDGAAVARALLDDGSGLVSQRGGGRGSAPRPSARPPDRPTGHLCRGADPRSPMRGRIRYDRNGQGRCEACGAWVSP